MAMVVIAVTVAAVASALSAAYRNQAYAQQQAKALGMTRDAVETIATRGTEAMLTAAPDASSAPSGQAAKPGLLGTLVDVVKTTVDALAGTDAQPSNATADDPADPAAAQTLAYIPAVQMHAMNGSRPAALMTDRIPAGMDQGKFLVTVTIPTPDGGSVSVDRVVADLSPRQ